METISRRQFIGSSVIVGAAALGVRGVHVNAAEEKALSANEQLGVMVMGCGGRGIGSHVQQFLGDPRTKILCIADPDITHLEKAAAIIKKKQGFEPKQVRDMREGLTVSGIDIVSCASTNHWHALCGVWAMIAGKDVYIEKPICHNIHEGKALIAAAKKYGRMCQVGSQCRSNPAIQDGIKFVHSGGIGDVKLVRGLCYKRRKAIGPLGKYPIPKEVDNNLWSGPAPVIDPCTRKEYHYDWHWQRLYGNGDSGNQGPHQTDIARTALGVNEFPSSVITYGGRLGYDIEMKNPNYVDAGDTANTEIAIYNYDDGKTLVFETRGLETEALNGAKIGVVAYGTEGYWVQIEYGHTAAYDLNGKLIKEFKGGSDNLHFNNFITACLKRDYSMLNADARCGYLSAGLAHLANISYYLGEQNKVSVDEALKIIKDVPGHDNNEDTFKRTVAHLEANQVDLKKTPLSVGPMLKFDPKKEHFIDNADAMKQETREYRGEFVVPDAEKV